MSTIKTPNCNAVRYVTRRIPFVGSHLYSAVIGGRYTVFSYGAHWPLYVHDPEQGWLENADEYSPTTGRHRTQARPIDCPTVLTSVGMLRGLLFPRPY